MTCQNKIKAETKQKQSRNKAKGVKRVTQSHAESCRVREIT
jgi:hypothetical protein